VSSGCAPLEGPAARVGVEDKEALEDMDGRYMNTGGWGIVCAMRKTKGIDTGPGGQEGFKKEKKWNDEAEELGLSGRETSLGQAHVLWFNRDSANRLPRTALGNSSRSTFTQYIFQFHTKPTIFTNSGYNSTGTATHLSATVNRLAPVSD